MTPEQKQTILLFFVGVFIDIIAAPYCYAASEAAMAKERSKAIVGYAIGIPLALTGLSTVAIALGVLPPSAVSSIALYVQPLATDPRWGLLIWFIVLVWLGGPRFVKRMRTAWNAKPQQQKYDIRELAMPVTPKKQTPSPGKVEAIRAMASVLDSRPVGDEVPKNIVAQSAETKPPIQTKPRAKLSKEAEQTLAMAREIDQRSAQREAARRAFNVFAPTRPMNDLNEEEWLRLETLFGVHLETVNNEERRYLTLKFLPDRIPQDGFSLLLIMFGYRQIYGWQDVRASGLEECLYLSNVRKAQTAIDLMLGKSIFDLHSDRLNIDDVAKRTALHGLVSEKLHLSKGGFYQLTDRGFATAQEMFTDLVRRA